MGTRPTCALCSAFNVLGNECRRKAPTLVTMNDGREIKFVGAYPGTRAESWCMEFLPSAEGETQQ